MITVRNAEKKDLDRIQTLLYQVEMVHHLGRPDLFRKGGQKYTEKELKKILKDPSTPVFVAVNETDHVLGYAFCMLIDNRKHNILTPIRSVYIDDLCVEEGLRGQHIGKTLYDYVLHYAKAQGCYNVTLNVWACNTSAMAFYEKCGMQVQKIGMEIIL